jgi:hypothetical protein
MKKLLLLFVCLFGINYFSSAQTDTLRTWPYVCQADSFPVMLSGWYASGSQRLDSITHFYRNDSLQLQLHYSSTVGPQVPMPFQIALKFQTPQPAYYTIYAKRILTNIVIATSTTHIGVCMGPTGLAENAQPQTEIYPNPASGWLYLKKLPLNTTAFVCDLTGKVLLRDKLTAGQAEIDLQKLAAGIYLLKLQSEKGTVVKKFVKH